MQEHSLPLPHAAARLGVSWAVAYRLTLGGELGPAEQVAGRWRVSAAGVEQYRQRAKPAAHEPVLPAAHA